MQRTIKIERLPKLDKVLRITFASIKKDFIESREEFIQLEEKVDSSLDIFRKRLNDAGNMVSGELKNRTDSLDKKIDARTSEIEGQVSELSASVEKFVTALNNKISEWNAKIKRLDDNSARATEIGAELKKIVFLNQELERISAIAGQVKAVEAIAVPRTEFKKEISEIDKKLEKITVRLKDSQEIMQAGTDKLISEARKESNERTNSAEDKIKAVSKELKETALLLKQEISKKPWTKELAEAVEAIKREISSEAKKRAEELEKHTVREKDIISKLSEEHKQLKEARHAEPQKKSERELFKEAKPKHETKEKKKGMLRRILDFLIEDVEEEKDKTLHEFDKKKGDKFEIKELDDLEKINK